MAKSDLDKLQKDIEARKDRFRFLVSLFFAGLLTIAKWREGMEREIENLYIQSFVLGYGGQVDLITEAWAKLQKVLDQHYQYLTKFGKDIDKLSEAQAAARAALYAQSAYQAYSVGQEQQAGNGRLTLPAYPGDISTECGSNCRCHWRIVQRADDGWDCYWIVDAAAESCKDCIERGDNWNPLVIYPS
jgi:hypothetical protein